MAGTEVVMPMSSGVEDSLEMGSLRDRVLNLRDVVFPALDSLPECPTLKILKRDFNGFIRYLFDQNNRREHLMEEEKFDRLQLEVFNYIIEVKHIGPRAKAGKGDKTAALDDSLEEIQPTNERERRAMVVLGVLKRHPDKALSTAQCKDLLEASDGMALDMKSARRAMEFLEIRYGPSIILEKIGKNSRIRTNFSIKETGQGVLKNQDYLSSGQGVLKESRDIE